MKNTEYIVTHYICRGAFGEGWIKTGFITRIFGKSDYFWGFSKQIVPPEKIAFDEENGSIQKLSFPIPIDNSQAVWITPEQKVYIANKSNPTIGEKRFVYQDNVLKPYDAIEVILDTIIKQQKNTPILQKSIDYYISDYHWKMVLDIFARKVKNFNITQDIFNELSYVFIRIQQISPPKEFVRMLNQHKMTFLGGTFMFTDMNGNTCRLEIVFSENDNIGNLLKNIYP